MWQRFVRLIRSKTFKRFAIAAYVIVVFVMFFAVFNPEPFLQYGYSGVFVYTLFGTGTVIVPVLARYMGVVGIAAVSATGMALNDSVSLVVGKNGDVIIPRSRRVIKIEDTLHRYGVIGLFVFAMVPMPYDIIGVIAGYLEFPYLAFVIPTFLGRFIRFLLLGSGSVAIWGSL